MENSKSNKRNKKRRHGGRQAISFATVKAALVKCWGNISKTAETLQIHYFSLQKILSKWPKLRQIQREAGEMRLDKTEEVYWKLIDEFNDPATVRHHLETKGKGRGYGKQPEPPEQDEPERKPGEAPSLEELAREEARLTKQLAAIERKERREQKDKQRPRPRKAKNPAKAKANPDPKANRKPARRSRKAPKRLSDLHPSDKAGLQAGTTPHPISQDNRGDDLRGPSTADRPDAPTPR